MDDTTLAKATIRNLDRPGSTSVSCMFNPKEYTFQKSNSWKEGETPAQNTSELQFSGGKPATLTMQLFFDTYADRIDVRDKYTDAFWDLMIIDESLKDKKNKFGRPPRVLFQWGRTWSFEAVITSMKQQFTLFLDTGIPVRATIDVTFQQVRDAKQLRPQNPTSGGDGGERIWRVQEGDTLAWIAYREYGDTAKWRLIATVNQLNRVRELVPGTILVIPNE
jgi:predicted Zn-dependent protease